MDVDLFDFDLPDDRIALRPAEPRDAAKLLAVPADGPLSDYTIRDLPDLLRDGDVLVVNNTRVIAGALSGVRERDGNRARVSANLLERLRPQSWRVALRPAKKVRVGETLTFSGSRTSCTARVVAKAEGGLFDLEFELSGNNLDDQLDAVGQMPLPPYIGARRPQDERDVSDYQTMFAEQRGSVAAPTAGLHFTPELLADLQARGIRMETVTLHVGGGTFLPVRVADTDDHKMHGEWGEIAADVAERLNRARSEGRRVVAVGTTSLRLLESAAKDDGTLSRFYDDTDIFITPGYRFRVVDALLTNFHLPRSTLFMLVSAFSGLSRMKSAYAHAIENDYRFYSYGDACLLERAIVTT